MNCAHDLKGHQAPLLAVLRCMAAVVSIRGYENFDGISVCGCFCRGGCPCLVVKWF